MRSSSSMPLKEIADALSIVSFSCHLGDDASDQVGMCSMSIKSAMSKSV